MIAACHPEKAHQYIDEKISSSGGETSIAVDVVNGAMGSLFAVNHKHHCRLTAGQLTALSVRYRYR